MGKEELSFRHTHPVKGLGICHHHREAIRIGHSHILCCLDHHTAEYELRILTTCYHPGHPVEGRIRVTAPEGFYEGTYHIVVVIALFIV